MNKEVAKQHKHDLKVKLGIAYKRSWEDLSTTDELSEELSRIYTENIAKDAPKYVRDNLQGFMSGLILAYALEREND